MTKITQLYAEARYNFLLDYKVITTCFIHTLKFYVYKKFLNMWLNSNLFYAAIVTLALAPVVLQRL